MLIIDASVAVKWLLSEEHTPDAVSLFRKPFKLVAPALIHLEVLSVLTKSVRRNKLEAADTQALTAKWNSLLERKAVFLPEHDTNYQAAVTLALETGHALYDCLYLALAKHLHAPLATADTRMEAVARTLGIEVFSWRSPRDECRDMS